MIVLDTNVLSKILRPTPDSHVTAWFKGQARASLFTTSVTRGEILCGSDSSPKGGADMTRGTPHWRASTKIWPSRYLSFDNEAADAYAEIAAHGRAVGRPISQFDAMIAAMARSRGASLATRNAKDFDECGIGVVNPWED
jgi:hypothetical protein